MEQHLSLHMSFSWLRATLSTCISTDFVFFNIYLTETKQAGEEKRLDYVISNETVIGQASVRLATTQMTHYKQFVQEKKTKNVNLSPNLKSGRMESFWRDSISSADERLSGDPVVADVSFFIMNYSQLSKYLHCLAHSSPRPVLQVHSTNQGPALPHAASCHASRKAELLFKKIQKVFFILMQNFKGAKFLFRLIIHRLRNGIQELRF